MYIGLIGSIAFGCADGAPGPTGPTGPKGDQGAAGKNGPSGTPGSAGDKGATGDVGPVGDTGKGAIYNGLTTGWVPIKLTETNVEGNDVNSDYAFQYVYNEPKIKLAALETGLYSMLVSYKNGSNFKSLNRGIFSSYRNISNARCKIGYEIQDSKIILKLRVEDFNRNIKAINDSLIADKIIFQFALKN